MCSCAACVYRQPVAHTPHPASVEAQGTNRHCRPAKFPEETTFWIGHIHTISVLELANGRAKFRLSVLEKPCDTVLADYNLLGDVLHGLRLPVSDCVTNTDVEPIVEDPVVDYLLKAGA